MSWGYNMDENSQSILKRMMYSRNQRGRSSNKPAPVPEWLRSNGLVIALKQGDNTVEVPSQQEFQKVVAQNQALRQEIDLLKGMYQNQANALKAIYSQLNIMQDQLDGKVDMYND